MLKRPAPIIEAEVTFAEAMTLIMRLGVGRPSSGGWNSAAEVEAMIYKEIASDRLAQSDSFSARTLNSWVNGQHLPKKQFNAVLNFFVHLNGESSDWEDFLRRAMQHSLQLEATGQKLFSGNTEYVDALYKKALNTRPDALTLPPGSPLVDFASVEISEVDPKSRRACLDRAVSIQSLQRGYYMSRSEIEASLATSLEAFLLSKTSSVAASVFWLDGRSGDGKSVLLARVPLALQDVLPHDFLYVPKLQDFYQIDPFFEGYRNRRLVLVVDDLAHGVLIDQADDPVRRKLHELDSAVESGFVRQIVVFTCGPTPELQTFRRKFPSRVVESKRIPALVSGDKEAFSEWFKFSGELSTATDDVILVEYLFCMQVGMTLEQFAVSFRARVNALFGELEPVKQVVAATAFDLCLPLSSLDKIAVSGISRLSEPDQNHFQFGNSLSGECVRFSHNQICKKLLSWWMINPVSKDSADDLGREIGQLLRNVDDERFAFELTERIRLHRYHADEICGRDINPNDLLYAAAQLLDPASVGWVSALTGLASNLCLERNREQCEALLNDIDLKQVELSSYASGAAILTARMAELAHICGLAKFETKAECIQSVLLGPHQQNSGWAIMHLVNRKIASPTIIEDWMQANEGAPYPPQIVFSMPESNLAKNIASELLSNTFGKEESVQVASWIASAVENASEAIDELAPWLEQRPAKNGAFSVLGRLQNRFKHDASIQSLTRKFVAENSSKPGTELNVVGYIKSSADNGSVRDLVVDYLRFVGSAFGQEEEVIRNRAVPVLQSLLTDRRLYRNQTLECATSLVDRFPESNFGNTLFAAILSNSHLETDQVEILGVQRAISLVRAGMHANFMAANIPVYLRRLEYPDELVALAYQWLDSSSASRLGVQVVTTLLDDADKSRVQGKRIWAWIERHQDSQSIETAIYRYFEKFEYSPAERSRVFEWVEQNEHRFSSQKTWLLIHRNYPKYSRRIGTPNRFDNVKAYDVPELEQERYWFEAFPSNERAHLLLNRIVQDPIAPGAVGAMVVLVGSGLIGGELQEGGLQVFKANAGDFSVVSLVTKLVKDFDLPNADQEFIAEWALAHKNYSGIETALKSCIEKGYFSELEHGSELFAFLLERFDWLGNQVLPLTTALADGGYLKYVDVSEFSRFMSLVGSGSIRNRVAGVISGVRYDFLEQHLASLTPVEAIQHWREVLRWRSAPEFVQQSFYSWARRCCEEGRAYLPKRVLEDYQHRAFWLDRSKLHPEVLRRGSGPGDDE